MDKLTVSTDDEPHGLSEMHVFPSGHAEHGPPTIEYGRPCYEHVKLEKSRTKFCSL